MKLKLIAIAGTLCVIYIVYFFGIDFVIYQEAKLSVIKDNAADTIIIEDLKSNTPTIRRNAIQTVAANPEKKNAFVLYFFVNALVREGREKEAVFWYHIAKMRLLYDLQRNHDQSLADIPTILTMELDKRILQLVYVEDINNTTNITLTAIDWDNAHEHDYNPLWAAPHGLGIFKPGEKVLAPKREWKKINEDVHAQWLGVIEKAVTEARLKQQTTAIK